MHVNNTFDFTNTKNKAMNKLMISIGLLFMIPLSGLAQQLEGLDFVSPIKNDMIAIEKNGQWAFINKEGDLIVNFSENLVPIKSDGHNYPYFENDRCLITYKKEGISYFGFIDRIGRTIIEPQFLNATAFSHNRAIALELVKEEVGTNELLDKKVVYYKYFEVVIDLEGTILTYLTDPVYIILDKEEIVVPPNINSKFITDNMVAVRNKNKTWTIKKVD